MYVSSIHRIIRFQSVLKRLLQTCRPYMYVSHAHMNVSSIHRIIRIHIYIYIYIYICMYVSSIHRIIRIQRVLKRLIQTSPNVPQISPSRHTFTINILIPLHIQCIISSGCIVVCAPATRTIYFWHTRSDLEFAIDKLWPRTVPKFDVEDVLHGCMCICA